MENYIVSARKYRPMSFDTVVGQSSLTTTLKNAIKNGKLAHAYLFCGPRGVGKTTCARIFAKTINCLSPQANGEACNECESCKAFNEQRSYNINELDAASNNSVDDIRQLIEQVRIPPQIGKYKVFIIDEVHMLSTAAFNAFLKTLEEPPHHAIFILATTEKHKLLPTILSRCQIYDFNRMSVDDTVAHLAAVAAREGIQCEPAALNVIAQKADGGMRDALSIFDQVASFCGGNITYQRTIENLNVLDYDYYFKITDYCLEGKITETMLTLNEILNKGFDGQHFITGLASHFRNLLVSRDAQTVSLIDASDDVRQRYQQQAQKCQSRFIMGAMKLCNNCDLNYKGSQNKRLLVELTLIEAAQLALGEEIPGSGRKPRKVLAPLFAAIKQQVAVGSRAPQARATNESARENGGSAPANAGGTGAVGAPGNAGGTGAVGAPANAGGTVAAGGTAAVGTAGSAAPIGRPLAPTETSVRRIKSTISIRGAFGGTQSAVNPQAETASVRQEMPVVEMNKPVDELSLRTAWRSFAHDLPHEEIAMQNRLDNIEPTLLDEYNFEVIADNPSLQTQLNAYVPRIDSYLRQRLQNSKIHMNVRLREASDKKKYFSRTEILNIMLEQSEGLRKLKEEFQLELG